LAQVELPKELLVLLLQSSQDFTDFFRRVAGDATETGQFVETTTKLQKGADQANRTSL
jgi:hypothetical protein